MANLRDPTFRNYKPDQAAYYAQHRPSYPPPVYNHVLKHHAEASGDFSQLLDIGCGPGRATRDLAVHFEHATGLDPGAAMIAIARDMGAKTRTGEPVRFEVSSAEELASAEGVKEGSVDMITAGLAAHWFSMPAFWEQAACVLKPGGTVALWTGASLYCHPSTPNVAEVQQVALKLERETLAPYELPGNRLARDMYRDLPLPWDVDPTQTAFPRELFVRDEFDRDGIPSNKETGEFFCGTIELTPKQLGEKLAVSSMVTRWGEANPDLVGTDQDVVKLAIKELKEALGEQESLRIGYGFAILMFQTRK